MQNLLAKISRLDNAYTGYKIDAHDIILYQRFLMVNKFPTMPEDFIKLLHEYNSLCLDGINLFGLHPRGNSEFDIISENALISHPQAQDNLILGFDELEYLVWNQAQNCYQTIDKDSFQVLNTYKTCETALLEFLKLSDDYKYLY